MAEQKWKYVKLLKNQGAISDFEKEFSCNLPKSFKSMIPVINGGRPTNSEFNTDKADGRAVKSFLSFNEDDLERITSYNRNADIKNRNLYVNFAIDNFGNFIAFDKKDYSVVFIDFEKSENNIEFIALNFEDFLDSLY